uniref:Uncharacterized protein n=1 Tax=Anopheles farauti TaxID=69004 RepID=A0A182Q979_9DIPT
MRNGSAVVVISPASAIEVAIVEDVAPTLDPIVVAGLAAVVLTAAAPVVGSAVDAFGGTGVDGLVAPAIVMLLHVGQFTVSVQLSHITLMVAFFPATLIVSDDSLSLSESKKIDKMSS